MDTLLDHRGKKVKSSLLNDINVFCSAKYFVVTVYKDSFSFVARTEFDSFAEAEAEIAKQEDRSRCLIYAVTESGRFAVMGHEQWDWIRKLMEDRQRERRTAKVPLPNSVPKHKIERLSSRVGTTT